MKLARKRQVDRESKQRRCARERALRPPEPDRRQLDGTLICIACQEAKAPSEFYTRKASSLPEGRCKACCRARRRELWAARHAEDGPAAG